MDLLVNIIINILILDDNIVKIIKQLYPSLTHESFKYDVESEIPYINNKGYQLRIISNNIIIGYHINHGKGYNDDPRKCEAVVLYYNDLYRGIHWDKT